MDEVLGVIAAFGISAQILFVAQKKAEQFGVTAGDGGLLSTSSPYVKGHLFWKLELLVPERQILWY